MTFTPLAAWQAWLLLGAAAAVASCLFLIKLRAPRVAVPSLLLWRRVLDEVREQTLWERIRRAVSLVLTVLIALALGLAALQPRPDTATATGERRDRVLVVLDSSWSMLARTRSGETRWERAIAQARRLASAAGGSELALATTADGLVEGPTTDRALLDAALDRMSPAGGDAASWPRLAGVGSVHFITDGTIARPLDPSVAVHSVFESAANVGITAFHVRPSLSGDRAGDAYLEVANYGSAAQRVRVRLTRGGSTLIDRQVDMAAGEALRQALPIARGPEALLRARVDARSNALDADDEAFAWIDKARPLAVAVVGEEIEWLRTLFENDPAVRTTFVVPQEYPLGTERADAVIFDRWSPPDNPKRPALYFAPDAGRGTAEARPRWESPGAHPVVRGVDPFTLTIDRARAYTSPDFAAVAQSTRGTPLVYVRDSTEPRAVLVTFGPAESNLTSAPAFPVLIGNALEWLTIATAPRIWRPGRVSFDRSVSTVTGPRGVEIPLVRIGNEVVAELRNPGLYVVQAGGARSTIAVNVGDPQVSNLTHTTLTATTQAAAVVPGGSRTAWWVYCALAAFALALGEWWTWQRRITV